MKKIIYIAAVMFSTAIGAKAFVLFTSTPEPEYALYYQQPRTIPAFELIDEQGDKFTNSTLTEHWSFVFLGYTSCPDICPVTLQNLHFIYPQLQEIASNSQVLLVTADPKRDSQAKLAQYIKYFNPEFKALRAEHDVLFPFTRSLGLMYAITDDSLPSENDSSANNTSKNMEYWVDHSASLILINPAGKVAAIFKPEHAVGEVPSIDNEKLLSDYKKIVDLY